MHIIKLILMEKTLFLSLYLLGLNKLRLKAVMGSKILLIWMMMSNAMYIYRLFVDSVACISTLQGTNMEWNFMI